MTHNVYNVHFDDTESQQAITHLSAIGNRRKQCRPHLKFIILYHGYALKDDMNIYFPTIAICTYCREEYHMKVSASKCLASVHLNRIHFDFDDINLHLVNY